MGRPILFLERKEVIMLELLKICMPIIVGALIAIIPTAVEKYLDRKNMKEEKRDKDKEEIYIELISLFSKVLKNQCNCDELDFLMNRINLISITGSIDVVKALNDYIDTWGKERRWKNKIISIVIY